MVRVHEPLWLVPMEFCRRKNGSAVTCADADAIKLPQDQHVDGDCLYYLSCLPEVLRLSL